MHDFDASKPWIILTPRSPSGSAASGTEAAAELARCIGILRDRIGGAGAGGPALEIRDGGADAPEDGRPVIVLNRDDAGRGGFAWRAGDERIEIYGDSRKGLANGVYDFLDALGFRWPAPSAEKPPEGAAGSTIYPLERRDTHLSSHDAVPGVMRVRRLVLGSAMGGVDGETWVRWAARNRLDAVVVPFDMDESTFDSLSDRVLHRRSRVIDAARRYGLSVEEGGRCLSRLVPRRLFLRNRELFRMHDGRRTADFNFCPTNPETVDLLREQARRRFRDRRDVEVFHLWPDAAEDGGWCSCPSCRAFTPTEQTLIAVNAIADVLAELRSGARISYIPDENDSGAVKPRANLIPVEEPRRKSETGAEADDWIFADRQSKYYT